MQIRLGLKGIKNSFFSFEFFNYNENKGSIAYIQLDQNTSECTQRKIVLKDRIHLSYPYIFEDQEKYYCIPETKGAKEIRLYKATDFPSKWDKLCTIQENITAVDNTILHYNGIWWFFSYNGSNDGLYIFYSDELCGPWLPHKNNPVKQDIRSSRPAGTPFISDNKLYLASPKIYRRNMGVEFL